MRSRAGRRFVWVVALVAQGACDGGYQSQIRDVPGPDAVAIDPAARARWTTSNAGDALLRGVACVPGGAVAVGERGAVIGIGAGGRPTIAPAAPAALVAIAATPAGLVAAGPGALWAGERPAEDGVPAAWTRVELPRPDALPRSVASGPGDTLWVAGRAPKGAATVGWAARRRDGQWTQHLFDDVPSVTQVLPRSADEAIVVVEATPYVWTASTGRTRYLMPAQPDAHPQIVAMDARAGGFVAGGAANAWRLDGTTLVRELRQLYMHLESVAALPDGRAVAVGRENPPGGVAGGLVLARDRRGHWHRELLAEGTPLHAVAHCGTRTIAVGEGGLVATRPD